MKSIIMIIGTTLKEYNLKSTILLLMLFLSVSCRSQSIEDGCPSVYDSATNNKVYTLVDEMPIFPINDGDIRRYIAHKYQDSSKEGIQMSVKLGFVINKKGKLIKPRILNKRESEYSEIECQIIEILKTSPQWKPGRCFNKKVDVLLRIRLRFVIDETGKLR